MRVTGSRAYSRTTPVPKMPSGLVELMEDLSKEVLKNNPENIYDFCAAHMSKLLEIRNGTLQEKMRQKAHERRQRYDKASEKTEKIIIDKNFSESVTPSSIEEKPLPTKAECVVLSSPIPHDDELISVENSKKEILHETISGSVNNKVNEKPTKIKSDDINVDSSNKEIISQLSVLNCEKKIYEIEGDNLDTTNALGKDDENGENEPSHKLTSDIVSSKHSNDKAEMQSMNQITCEMKELDKEVKMEIPKTQDEFKQSECANKMAEVVVPVTTNIEDVCGQENRSKEVPNDNSKVPGTELSDADTIIEGESSTNISKEGNESHQVINAITESEQKTIISEDTCDTNSEKINLSENYNITVENEIPNAALEKNSIIDSSTTNELQSHENLSAVKENDDSIESKIHKILEEPTDRTDTVTHFESEAMKDNTSHVDIVEPNTSMDLETAAITIQKVFRSFLFKSRASTCDSHDGTNSLEDDSEKKELNEFSNLNIVKDRRGIGLTRMDTVLQTVNEEKSLSLSTDDSSTLSSAATIIQAHVRGFLVRNKFKSNNTLSSNSVPNSDISARHDNETEAQKCKTVLNIHIVPDGAVSNLSRDESILTSMELSLDGSPPSSVNLHPLGYNKSEPRKQLKREDAIQSVSPPSNNSGKLSEDVDSVKEILINEVNANNSSGQSTEDLTIENNEEHNQQFKINKDVEECSILAENVVKDAVHGKVINGQDNPTETKKGNILKKMTSDEMDVVTPFVNSVKKNESTSLLNSGELHDAVLPTKVLRNDTSVVREFKAVLVYFILWDK
ncbi:uncharacterized protein LOC114240388 isoform X3 [Bombyx mandarina]|uniref:Uncharacterized protein LOC114240388 isoform X3 n=1 Tax=Bombyx mandarina TaxID=7092 RepID=A0A6J2JB36_BOMMA|nr:uncharacterized protein LOC114240388 isoform X3 [Bombyx mandarina]